MQEQEIRRKLKPVLDQHPYVSLEFDEKGFLTLMENFRPNLLGNFAGGDMAYIANAAAGLLCLAQDRLSETASINIECLQRADGQFLLARSEIIKSGNRLIRLRVDVFVRNGLEEKLVAIAQVNMAPIHNSNVLRLVENTE
ncbi:MAG: PaaI family thioesterase [Acidobacteria bacterium]|nr:PaaI family thioesterase [Acidobacteriota bacterium]